jgi:predicted dehydrogenase
MKISAVIIGLGQQSLTVHIPALLRRDDVRLTGVYDPDPEAHAEFQEAFPDLAPLIPAYNDLAKMLESVRPHVAVVTPDTSTVVIEELCRRHMYFYKDGSFAQNLNEAKKMLDIPGFSQYCFAAVQQRHNALYTKALEILPSIGTPYLFHAIHALNSFSPEEKNQASSACLLDAGYRTIDQMVWWFGMPNKLNAQVSFTASQDSSYNAEDSASISFQYTNGMHGTLIFSRAGGDERDEYAAYGPNGYLVGSNLSLSVYDRQGQIVNHVTVDNPDTLTDAQLDFFMSRVRAQRSFNDVNQQCIDNLHFIERCYQDALDTSALTAVG